MYSSEGPRQEENIIHSPFRERHDDWRKEKGMKIEGLDWHNQMLTDAQMNPNPTS